MNPEDKPARLPTAQQDLMGKPYAWQAVGGTIWTSEDNRPYTKPQWQGLTDDDVNEITQDVIAFKSDIVDFIGRAEAKLREKNT